MGCGGSKDGDSRLQQVDDSVHVMIKHDKKVQQQKGEAPHGYVPRQPHPLLQQTQQQTGTITATEESGEMEPAK